MSSVKTSERIHVMTDGSLFITVKLDGNDYEPALGLTTADAEQFEHIEDFEQFCIEEAFHTLRWPTYPTNGIGKSCFKDQYSKYRYLHRPIYVDVNDGEIGVLIGITKEEIMADKVKRPFGEYKLSECVENPKDLLNLAKDLRDKYIPLPEPKAIPLPQPNDGNGFDDVTQRFLKDMLLYKDPVWQWARSWDKDMALAMVKSYGPDVAYEFFKASMELETELRVAKEEDARISREAEKAAAVDLVENGSTEPQEEIKVEKSDLFKGYANKYIENRSIRLAEDILADPYLAQHCTMNKIRLSANIANNKVDDILNSIDFVKAVEEDLNGKLDVVRNQAEFKEAVDTRREALKCSLLANIADMMAAANKAMSGSSQDLIPPEVLMAVMVDAGNNPVGLISPVVKEATEQETLDVLISYPGLQILQPMVDKLKNAGLSVTVKVTDNTNIGAMSDAQILSANIKVSDDKGFVLEKEFDLMVTSHPHDPSKTPIVTWKPSYKKAKKGLVKVAKNQPYSMLSNIEDMIKFLGV